MQEPGCTEEQQRRGFYKNWGLDMVTDGELLRRAFEVAKPRRLSKTAGAATVGSALVTDRGTVYVGVCIDTACSLGFCAEHNAIGNMVTSGEKRIVSIVAVNYEGKVLSPCGRCREFIWQMDPDNAETRILLENGRVTALRELLPESWLVEAPPPTDFPDPGHVAVIVGHAQMRVPIGDDDHILP